VIAAAVASGHGAVIACSALKSAYRAVLLDHLTPADVRFALLDGDPAILAARLAHRTDHFMNPALLQSQIDTLERPDDAIIVDVAWPVDAQVDAIRAAIGA
jgi:gluconokinase